MLIGLHHVQVACPAGSEDILRAFYGGVLGMTEVAKPPVLAAACEAAGNPVEWDPHFPGHRWLYVAGPVGNSLELLEPLAED